MGKSRILVVDDDVHNLMAVQSILDEEFEIKVVMNGKEAIELLAREMFDLILLDWNMPVMDGLCTLKFIRSNPGFDHVLIIMMTGYMTSNEDLVTAYENGVIDFVRKPFVSTELVARVRTILMLKGQHLQELEIKNKEQVALSLQLVKFNELLRKMADKLEEISAKSEREKVPVHKEINDLNRELQFQTSDFIWEQFNRQFQQTNQHFVRNLIGRFQNLTPFEIKLSSMLYLNLDTKEISSLLFQSYDSIRVSRTRLRKKLGLKPEENLYCFLNAL